MRLAVEFFQRLEGLLVLGLAFQTSLQFFERLTIPLGVGIEQSQHDMSATRRGIECLGLLEGAVTPFIAVSWIPLIEFGLFVIVLVAFPKGIFARATA